MTLAHAVEVCANMRELDAECVREFVGTEPGEWFAVNRWQTHGPSWALMQGPTPVAIGGVTLQTDWMALCWLVATPSISRHSWGKLVRHCRTVLSNLTDPAHPQYRHRIEAHVLNEWSAAARFAESFGLVHEHTRQAAGATGKDVQVWVKVGPAK